MAIVIKKLEGSLPVSRQNYTEGTTYYKDNIVTRYGSAFQCVVDSTTTPPATIDASGKVTLGEGWIFFADTSAISNAVAEHTEKITKIEQLQQEGYTFMGEATPETNPGTPDQKVFYIASTDGTYVNFGGVIIKNSISVLLWDASWKAKEIISMTGYNQSKSVSLITSLDGQSPNIPNISLADGTISFGPENAFVVGNDLYEINNRKPFTLAIKPTAGSDIQTTAVKLVLNTQDSSIRTMPLADALSNNDMLIGVFRVNYGPKLTSLFGVNLPFEYTIDNVDVRKSYSIYLSCGTSTDVVLPECDTKKKTITFGPETSMFLNDVLYDISNKKILLVEDTDSTVKKIWFNPSSCEFKSLSYNRPVFDSVLIGVARLPVKSEKIYLSLPFNVSFDGNKNVPNYYDPNATKYALQNASSVSLITSLDGQLPSIPNISLADGTISFGPENAFVVGNDLYEINNRKPFTLAIKPTAGSDIQTTAVKLVLNTQDSSIRTMPLADALSNNDMLIGVFRVNYGPKLTSLFGVNLPFEYTVDNGFSQFEKRYTYDGEKVEIGNSFQIKKINMLFSIVELQGMTAFDKYLIRVGNEQGGRCNIMSMATGSLLGDFILASKSDVNHTNCLELGEKYSDEDLLPLIYISEASGNHRCFVERIKNDFSGSSLIQTITFAGTYPDGGIGNDWVVDSFNIRLFNCISVGNVDCKVLVFNLPDYKDGDISLSDNDIIDTFNVPVKNIMQGATYNSGKLFLPLGFGNATNPAEIIVYDINRKTISSKVNLQSILLSEEPEDVCVLGNELLLGTQSKVIYKLKF